jgi:hypothetical protein
MGPDDNVPIKSGILHPVVKMCAKRMDVKIKRVSLKRAPHALAVDTRL